MGWRNDIGVSVRPLRDQGAFFAAARGNRDREVPGRNDSDDPDRLARDLDVDVGPDRGELLAGNSQRLASEEVEDLAGSADLVRRFRQGLALLAGEKARQFLAPREDLRRGA